MPEPSRYCALVPAAGRGTRFAGGGLKQYLALLERPLIYYAIATLCANALLDRVVVVLSGDDNEWGNYDWSEFDPKLKALRCGGHTRAHSVLNALNALAGELAPLDWMLVHDAARPCLDARVLNLMIETLADDAVGGLLAVPLTDTLKHSDHEGRVDATPRRDALWRAQTPQMFRYGLLRDALSECIDDGPTDEAGAIERRGLRPRLVQGSARNIKVTYPADLALAELFIRNRSQ